MLRVPLDEGEIALLLQTLTMAMTIIGDGVMNRSPDQPVLMTLVVGIARIGTPIVETTTLVMVEILCWVS